MPLAKARERPACRARLFNIDCDQCDPGSLDEKVEVADATCAMARLEDD